MHPTMASPTTSLSPGRGSPSAMAEPPPFSSRFSSSFFLLLSSTFIQAIRAQPPPLVDHHLATGCCGAPPPCAAVRRRLAAPRWQARSRNLLRDCNCSSKRTAARPLRARAGSAAVPPPASRPPWPCPHGPRAPATLPGSASSLPARRIGDSCVWHGIPS
ncbi:proline-rich receptor-like protein kinase PERK8 [Iris pallida]|uniref:Proline-rich receptor-like protein kinase PERK8 n=1 Tax=Iris pallida TaxID=29817 RepID=A0AAX6DU24_IRIPA|nr:proline-rich receptor-like protein kinase PERK8 [Iris pallida]